MDKKVAEKKICKACAGNGWYVSNISKRMIKCSSCRGTGVDFHKNKPGECEGKHAALRTLKKGIVTSTGYWGIGCAMTQGL